MDFDVAVAAFQRKKRGQDVAAQKREQYRAMLKEYTSMKYSTASGGVRKEREITQELIERREEAKASVTLDALTESLADFVDLELPPVKAPKGKGKRK